MKLGIEVGKFNSQRKSYDSVTHIEIMDISIQKCHGIISWQANW